MVNPEKAIMFNCEKCDAVQFSIYSLKIGVYKGEMVRESRINCSECHFQNHIVESKKNNVEHKDKYNEEDLINDLSYCIKSIERYIQK